MRENNGGATGKDASYFTYFRRGDTSHSDNIVPTSETTATFDYEIQLVGSYYLMSILSPFASRRTLDIKLTGTTPADEEVLVAEIKGSPTQDAFPRYDELFADGVLDMGIHFGGDYNKERYDIETAKWFVGALLEGGWTSPGVTKFEELTIDSQPFEKEVMVEGKAIVIRVFVYHADMVPHGEESRLSDAMKTTLAERDIVMYSGMRARARASSWTTTNAMKLRPRSSRLFGWPTSIKFSFWMGVRPIERMFKTFSKTQARRSIISTS